VVCNQPVDVLAFSFPDLGAGALPRRHAS
jgi:hypothetical protein